MNEQSPFPERPNARLTRDDVVNYLLEQKQLGYEVYKAVDAPDAFDLILDNLHFIRFIMSNPSKPQVQGYKLNQIINYYNVTGMIELRHAMEALTEELMGAQWQQIPSTGRLTEETPASNLATISNLIGSCSVEAIFDPYLENRSLTTLTDILSFGAGSVAENIRVLSTNKTTTGNVPRLTKHGFDFWLTELGITGEIRIMESSEHRRFMLITGGESLLLGPSLNSLNKNEAISREPDTQDKIFFNQVWAEAATLA